MALNADAVRVPGTGELFVGAVGTAAPTNVATALNAAFVGLGYTEDGGVTISRSLGREPVTAWQSIHPLKYIYSAGTLNVSTALRQAEEEVAALWWGSDFAANALEFKADMSTVPTAVERAVVVEWFDDESDKHRLYIPKAEVTETGDLTVARQAQSFSITFSALAPDSGSVLATWFTDSADFDPA